MNSAIKSRNGFSLIEVIIAVAIVNILIVGVLEVSNWALRSVAKEKDRGDLSIENNEVFKLVIEPAFFAKLSTYPQNAKLKECIEIDSKSCESSEWYPLVLFDVSEEKSIENALEKNINVKNDISFKVHCANNAETCDQAEFFYVNVKSAIKNGTVGFANSEKTGLVTPSFDEVSTYIPDTKVEPGRPISVILFLIDSRSSIFQS